MKSLPYSHGEGWKRTFTKCETYGMPVSYLANRLRARDCYSVTVDEGEAMIQISMHRN